jgi:hypothetical protein
MTDDELVGYCDIHCETPRAMFSREHANRMIALAGYPKNFVREVPEYQKFLSAKSEMKELCRLARVRKELLASPQPYNVVSLSQYRNKHHGTET